MPINLVKAQCMSGPNKSPPPLHMVGFTKPALSLQAASFSLVKDFVNMSDPFTQVCTFLSAVLLSQTHHESSDISYQYSWILNGTSNSWTDE